MSHTILISALVATLCLAACDKPTVANVPATPVAVPGPPGQQSETGAQGMMGTQGAQGTQGMMGNESSQGAATGKSGDGTTVIVVPPEAAAPAN